MTSSDFEKAVALFLEGQFAAYPGARVVHGPKISGHDGDYALDVLVTVRIAEFDFKIVVECKHHRRPVERDHVQILHSRIQSLGCHKGVVFSTSGYQVGALRFAKEHGIALVRVTDGQALYETRSINSPKQRIDWLPQFAFLMTDIVDETSLRQKRVEPNEVIWKEARD